MQLEDVQRVAVLGAGNMGHGIAEVAALAGYDVSLRDIKEEFVQDGYDGIEWSLGKLAEKTGSATRRPTLRSTASRRSSTSRTRSLTPTW